MRIVLVPESDTGSAGLVTRALAQSLARSHQVTLIGCERDEAVPAGQVQLIRGECAGIHTVTLTCGLPVAPWETLDLVNRRALDLFAGELARLQPEVVHFQGVGPLSWGALWGASRAGAAVVLTLRDCRPVCHRGALYTVAGEPCGGPRGGEECLAQGCLEWPGAYQPGEDDEPAGGVPAVPEPGPGRWWYRLLRRVPGPLKALVPGRVRMAAREAGVPREPAPCAAAPAPWLGPWRQRLAARAVAQAQVVTVTSPELARRLREHSLPHPALEVVPDPAAVSPRLEPVPDHPFTVTYLGRVAPDRRVHDLIAAFNGAGLNEACLLVAGPGRGEYACRLRLQATHPGIAFLGRLRGEQIPELLAASDLLVATGDACLPLPGAVAMARACRVPVLAASSPDLAEVISDEVTGLLYPPGDVVALQAALVWAAGHRGELAKLAVTALPPPTPDEVAAACLRVYAQAREGRD